MESSLIQAMSDSDIREFLNRYPDNQSIQTELGQVLEARKLAEEQAKARDKFAKQIEKLAKDLPHPTDIHNVYLAWRETEEEDTTQQAEEVTIATPEGVNVTETRYPLVKLTRWVVEVNKGFMVETSQASTPSTSKRAISVYKRNGQVLEPIGNFPSGQACADYLKIPTGQSSANKVLRDEGYIVDAYDGTDFKTA